MKKKKVLIVIPSLVGGGAEKALVNLLHKMDYSKYEIDLLTVLNKGIYIDKLPSEVNLHYLFNNEFFVRSLAFLQKRIGLTFPYKLKLDKVLTKKYDVGISFLDSNFTDVLFFTNNINKKYTWVHSSYVSNPNYSKSYKSEKYRKKLIKNRYSKLDGIYFVSENAKEEFIEVFGSYPKMEVIYNMINKNEVIKKSEEKLILPKSKFRFVAVGSLYKVKGYDKLIRASKIIKDQGFDFEVIIAGKGYEENNLKRLVSLNKLDEVVKFVGYLNNPYPLLRSSDVFIMTSISEALPTVLCEAMILERATLVTNCSGCREIVNNGEYGLMVEQTLESIAENMIKYMESNDTLEYFSNKSTERSKIFNDKRVLNSYYDIFDN